MSETKSPTLSGVSETLLVTLYLRAMGSQRSEELIKDVKAVALAVLRHRIVTNFNADADGISTDNIIDMLLEGVEA